MARRNRLPKAVQKQIENADRITEQLYGDDPDKPEGEQATPPEGGEDETLKGQETDETPPSRPDENSPEYWKQKYSTLEGKYRAEVPGLHNKVQQLEQLLSNMQAPEPVDATKVEAKRYITQDDIEEFGEDTISMMQKAAREAVSSEIEALRQENEQLRQMLGQVSTVAQETARESLLKQLADAIPDWEAQNVDNGFLAWLQQSDLYSGHTRQQLLVDAFNKNDARRVIALFKAYRDEAGTAPAAPTQGTQPPAPDADNARTQVSMDTLVAPGGPGTSSGQTSEQGSAKIYTRSEIAQFYEKRRKGAFKNDPKKAEQIEADIFRAASENRVRPG